MARRRTKAPQAPRLLGLGLDNQDGHKRLTQGEGFLLAGGSEETHERMAGTVIRTVEDLGRKGRTLADAEAREVMDLIRKNAEKA